MVSPEAFQLIIVEKCNIEIIFYNVTRTFACGKALILYRRGLEMMSQRQI